MMEDLRFKQEEEKTKELFFSDYETYYNSIVETGKEPKQIINPEILKHFESDEWTPLMDNLDDLDWSEETDDDDDYDYELCTI
jgi:hypothetical protein